MTEQSAKGKRPPSFPHVHPSRARKFKKAWVEKAKITSKWRAQRKKEGLVEKAKLEIPQYELEERDDPDGQSPDQSHEAVLPEETPPPQRGLAKTPHHSRTKHREETSSIPRDADEDDVRELMRKAYSKSNLHTFKSDPLKKRGASGRTKGEKGKGQPNMKLRMNALLAKIKQDCT